MKKILAIEDNTVIVKILQHHMRDILFSIAVHPDEGIAKAIEDHPDLILLDIMLPDRGGFTVLEELKKRNETKDIPVLMFTALGSQDDIEKGMKMGAIGHIVKGMESIDVVAQRIRDLLGVSEKNNNGSHKKQKSQTTKKSSKLAEEKDAPQKQKIIFFVEDDHFLVQAYRDMLEEDASIALWIAQDGDEALTYLSKPPPDVVLLDLMLPGKNGFEVLTAIRSSRQWEHVPVIILSNLGQHEDIEHATKLGITDYIVKANTRISDVAARIRRILFPPVSM